MRTFTCLFRASADRGPMVSLLLTSDVGRARELARRQMAANASYLGFELREGNRLICAEDHPAA